MDGDICFTLNQMLKSKGFSISTALNETHMKAILAGPGRKVEFTTGLRCEAIRYCERLFSGITGIELEPTSTVQMGVSLGWAKRIVGGTSATQTLQLLNALDKEVNRKKEDEDGFLRKEKDELIVSYDELENHPEADGFTCKNKIQAAKGKMLVAEMEWEGEWDGLVFKRKKVGEQSKEDSSQEVKEELRALFEEWKRCDTEEVGSEEEEEEEVAGDEVEGQPKAAGQQRDLVARFHSVWASTNLTEEERHIVINAGGTPLSAKQKKDFSQKVFPLKELDIKSFLEEMLENVDKEWNYEEKQRTYGWKDKVDFILGQVARCRGQIEYNRGTKTLKYVPQPVNYLRSQRKLAHDDPL